MSDPPKDRVYGRCEMDSHADTCVAGANCTILHITERVCNVMPYTDEYEAKTGVPIVRAATGYTASDGRSYILVLDEALWIPTMPNTLLNPNQMRHHGTTVQDNPFLGGPMHIRDHTEEHLFCLRTAGSTIYLNTWSPTRADLEEYPKVFLTADVPWDPERVQLPTLSEQEIDDFEASANEATIGALRIPSREPIDSFRRHIMSLETKPMVPGPLDADEMREPRNFLSSKRHSNVTPEDLSDRWGISREQAEMTLKTTTQYHVRSATMPLFRRYRTDRMYNAPCLRTVMATDTMDLRGESADGNKFCQVFGNRLMFADARPIRTKGDCHEALKGFIAEYGAPDLMVMDGSQEQTAPGSKFQGILRKHHIPVQRTHPQHPNQNPAETIIRELRKRWYRTVFRTNCPRSLWNYALPHISKLMQLTASNAAGLNGRTPLEVITGDTPDISEYLDFSFYDRVWYKDNAGLSVPKPGRFLGVAHRVGHLMSYWILPESGRPIAQTTVSRVTPVELQTDQHKSTFSKFDKAIADKFKEPRLHQEPGDSPDLGDWQELLAQDDDFAEEFAKIYNNADIPEADDDFTPDSFDPYLSMEVALDRGLDHPQVARVTKRLKDANGLPIGTSNDNPILDTRLYEVEFLDGHKQALTANQIATSMFAQVDEEGRRQLLFDSIIDVRSSDAAVKKEDAFVVSKSGNRCRRETTRGWSVLIQWKDGSTTWNSLKDVKDAYPVQMAEYAEANKISDEPAFAWWVPYTLKKKAIIINKVKSKYWSRTHKYGIRIPKSVQEALEIDRENGDHLWWDALMKEMRNVRPAFEVYEGDVKSLVGYQKIKCHIVWDVKLGENFRRKARLVAGGHTTEAPPSVTYSSVVARDSVRIMLTIAALNDLNILACDIQNAYLTAKCRERIYTVAGPEFGSEKGKTMVIKQALYGLKSSGAAFHSKLASVIWDLQYRPSKADADVWMRPAMTSEGVPYYEYVLAYVDDVIAIGKQPDQTIAGIQAVFKLKNDKAEVPDMYLGAQLHQVSNANSTRCWAISSEKYLKTALENVEKQLALSGQRLPSKCFTPFTYNYHPADDTTAELNAEGTQYFQELVGVLRWSVELGRVDILLEVALLSTHLALPRAGHLQQVYHIFGYIKQRPRRRLYMDPDYPEVSDDRFQRFDWEDFYKDASEELPPDMPEPRGKAVEIHCFVDASHASDKATRRSQTGILIFLNRAPILWYSKRQNSVETSTFGSEFTALKSATEMVKALRYKLRMFGIPLVGPGSMYCDNEAVFKNVSTPESVLSKKHHSIAYHFCREAVAAQVIRIAKEDTETNIADLFTKVLSKDKRESLIDSFMY